MWLFEEPNEPPEAEDDREASPWGIRDEQLWEILDFSGLLRALGAVACDHPLSAVPPPAGPLKERFPGDLRDKVREFLAGGEFLSLSITILFTDHGMSLAHRAEGGLELTFFPDARRDPGEEQKIRALFNGLGVAPHVDYLANRARTRILGFAAPEDLEQLVTLCGRVLRDVHEMRTDDSLAYRFLAKSDIKRS